MHQISLTKSDTAALTPAQRSAWARRGHLVLKAWAPRSLTGRLTAGDAAAYAEVRDRLAILAGEIADEPLTPLSLQRGLVEPFGMDAIDRASGLAAHAVTAAVGLGVGSAAGWRHVFFPGSHLTAEGEAGLDPGAEMFRVATLMRELGLKREMLRLEAGDVWLRHPRLVRGAVRTGGAETAADWLIAGFGQAARLRTRGAGDGPVWSIYPRSRRERTRSAGASANPGLATVASL